ncbi:Protein Y55F3C.10 [Aphelenchoides avenae]|nr:Protein Y55F3C.10 [Aphelenchus avenae]
MEMFIFHRDEYNRLYNCSLYSVEDVPIEKRQSVLLGFMFMVLFTIYELLYIPCLFAIRKHMDQTCYKLMFYIGITDVACLWVNAFFTGYFAATGAVFCSHPTLIYITGVLGTSLWAAESTTDILLAVSRCVEMTSPHWGKVLFGGNRTWLWVIPPSLYGLYFAIFTKPVLFSGLFVSWFFNPHVGYIDDFGAVYHNDLHTFHNSFIFIGITVTYGLFGIILFAKTSRYDKRSSSQKMTFIQVMLISAVNAIASAIYIYMQFVRISDSSGCAHTASRR